MKVITITPKMVDNKIYMDPEQFPDNLNDSAVIIDIYGREYTIYQQNAMAYGEYSEYIKSHGCACCSLTTLLSGYVKELIGLTPDKTIAAIERAVLGEDAWQENYSKPIAKQMPVSFRGIRRILDHFGIKHRLVAHFDRDAAHTILANHLETGRPAVIETSKIRYNGNWPVSINDKKFAGSYHTMIILGIEEDGDTVWITDSATRKWAGKMQRLKRVSLAELITYMFPCAKAKNDYVYFNGRRYNGGFILINEQPVVEKRWDIRRESPQAPPGSTIVGTPHTQPVPETPEPLSDTIISSDTLVTKPATGTDTMVVSDDTIVK